MKQRTLIGIPIFNEEDLLEKTLDSLYNAVKDDDIDILAYDDGSTDFTPKILREKQKEWGNKLIINNHAYSLGYGKTIIDILKFGCSNKGKYEYVITFDADLQHNPETLSVILETLRNKKHVDVISSSRYLDNNFVKNSINVPVDRFLINMNITKLLNSLYSLNLTDSFSGFKGYRVCRVESMFNMRDVGYSSPIEFWINTAFYNLFVVEVPTPLIYIKGRESRGNEKPWKDRLNNYLNAFKTYAWEDSQRDYVNSIEPTMMSFINEDLKIYHENQDEFITTFQYFWKRHKESEKNIYSKENMNNLEILSK
ncbi:MAG: Undecaprenyl-phosphate mannosyltransferase [Candidatus Heimdallarchaeota archaeon LC_3]|nr:MAG: Undecaprenyl-phosphate mannosyltransferase [Candidatus Heimdallarchaeota archaeon LC_3]